VVTPYRLGCWGAVRSHGGSLPALRRTARLTIERVRRAMPRNPDVMALGDLLDQLMLSLVTPSRVFEWRMFLSANRWPLRRNMR
jgi:hypothetical protein